MAKRALRSIKALANELDWEQSPNSGSATLFGERDAIRIARTRGGFIAHVFPEHGGEASHSKQFETTLSKPPQEAVDWAVQALFDERFGRKPQDDK